MATITKDQLTKDLIFDFHAKFFARGLRIIYPNLSIDHFTEVLNLIHIFYQFDIDADDKRGLYRSIINKIINKIHLELGYTNEVSVRKYEEVIDLLTESAQETCMFLSSNHTLNLFGSNNSFSNHNTKE